MHHRMCSAHKHAPRLCWSRFAQLGPSLRMRVCCSALRQIYRAYVHPYASHLCRASISWARVGGFASLLLPGLGATKWRKRLSKTHHGGRSRTSREGAALGGLGCQAGRCPSSEAAGLGRPAHTPGVCCCSLCFATSRRSLPRGRSSRACPQCKGTVAREGPEAREPHQHL